MPAAGDAMTDKIGWFRGDYYNLSNFGDSPAWFDGDRYPTAEHAFQAAKVEDRELRRRLFLDPNLTKPGDAKRLGRKKRTVPLRPMWDEGYRLIAMAEVLVTKFAAGEARELLLSTGDAILEEGNNWHDTRFGVCHCATHGGTGSNWMGAQLMTVRAALWMTA
jgi:ribA/ribD-fused uncharacterized protein